MGRNNVTIYQVRSWTLNDNSTCTIQCLCKLEHCQITSVLTFIKKDMHKVISLKYSPEPSQGQPVGGGGGGGDEGEGGGGDMGGCGDAGGGTYR